MLKKLIVLLAIISFPSLAQAAGYTAPQARVFDLSGAPKSDFLFFDSLYSGGTDLAVGDINGDGLHEIILCPSSGYKAVVKSYSSYGVAKDEINAYGSFSGGCYVSAADINGDGQAEVVTGAGFSGGPHVKVFEIGKDFMNFFAFGKQLRQGVRVKAADLGGDGKAEIIAFSNVNAPAEYSIFGNDGHKISSDKLKDFNSNGINLAVGDFNGDGAKELAFAGGFGNKPIIEIFDKGNKLLKKITYGSGDYSGGLNLAAFDVNGDKKDELIVTESFNGSGVVSAYDFSGNKILSFNAFEAPFSAGVKVAVGDVNGDGASEIVAVPERVGDAPAKADYKFIKVDLSKQTLYRYQDGKQLDSFLISSGLAKSPTPTGDFKINRKRPNVRMTWYYGRNNPMNYDLPNVPWVASFSGPYTIHGTYWHNNFGHPMSHGCVNMKTPEAKIVYDWVSIGTPILIY